MSELLPNYLAGRWQAGTGAATALFDPVLGTELVRVSSTGLDLAEAFAMPARQGGAALRALTYRERAALLAAMARCCRPTATTTTRSPRPTRAP
jgi:3,4-dehydroadipyl-CoA semialdehyde dehydrogenase